jgi:hypothetical protein
LIGRHLENMLNNDAEQSVQVSAYVMGKYVIDVNDFRESVFSRVPPRISRQLLEVVIGAFVATGQHEQRDISTCIQLVGILQRSGLALPEDVVRHQLVGTARSAKPTPETRQRSAQLMHQIEASVQAVRRTLFEQPSAPFASLPEAFKWMEGEVRQLYEGIAAWACTLYQPLWDQALEPPPPAVDLGTPETSQRLSVLLEAVRAGMIGWVAPAEHGGPQGEGRHGFVDTPVCQLQRYVRQLARASGFSPPDIAAYLLADIPPILDAATISVEHLTVPVPFGGGEIQPSQVTLTLHARDLSYHEHRALFRQVRQELNLVRVKGLTDGGIEFGSWWIRWASHPPAGGQGCIGRGCSARGTGIIGKTALRPQMGRECGLTACKTRSRRWDWIDREAPRWHRHGRSHDGRDCGEPREIGRRSSIVNIRDVRISRAVPSHGEDAVMQCQTQP